MDNLIIIKDEQKENELRFAMFVAMHSAIRSIDHLSELFNQNLVNKKGSKLQNMNLHRTKCTALITKVLAPSMHEGLLDDLKGSPYSIILDESTDVSTRKYLCFCVRYFSKHAQNVQVGFLGLVEVDKTSAEMLFRVFVKFLEENGLKITNLVGLGTDGANNLCGKHNSLFALIKREYPKVELVRCICHSINLASSAAANLLPANLDYLCREVYNWFNVSSLRRFEYKLLFDILNQNEKTFHNFIQLSGTRWLCRHNVIKVILEHYEELKLHFNVVVTKEKCYSARILNEMLNDDSNYLYLVIIEPIFSELNKVNCLFQKDNIEIGSAADEIVNIIMFIGRKIFKPIFIQRGFRMVEDSLDNSLAYLDPDEMDFGVNFKNALKKMNISPDVSRLVMQRAAEFLKGLLNQLFKRLPDSIDHFRKLQAFSPCICLSHVARFKFSDLPFINMFCDENKLSVLENQYNLLLEVKWETVYGAHIFKSCYTFWPIVAKHTRASAELAFKELSDFVLLLLSLPTSNASVERVFSIMNLTKNKLRNKMQLQLLTSLLSIKTTMYNKKKCCSTFEADTAMLKKFNNSIYASQKDNTNDNPTEIYAIFDGDPKYDMPCISIN